MKTLQKRMILAVFLSVLVVFLILLGLVDISLGFYYRRQASEMVELIRDNGGVVPDTDEDEEDSVKKKIYKNLDIDEESAYRTRYFLIHYDVDGQISEADLDHVAAVDQDSAATLTENVLDRSKNSGYISGYYYTIVDHIKKTVSYEDTESDDSDESTENVDEKEGGVIIFLDCTRELTFRKTVLIITAMILIILCGIVTFIFGLISERIIRPFEENSRRQKQFITDASHELKTPLAIISANADVLRYKDGDSSWLDNITCQTVQMNKLIGDLLALTKADEMSDDFVKEKLDFIPLICGIWDSFRETAVNRNVTMQKDVPDSLIVRGNREMLERLCSVLTENAVKYVSEGGKIRLTIYSTKKQVVISMYNTADLGDEFDCTHLFDRFYRPDRSRTSSTGGHGIGLSIAKKIVDNHKGKITASCQDGGIVFKVTLLK